LGANDRMIVGWQTSVEEMDRGLGGPGALIMVDCDYCEVNHGVRGSNGF